MWSGCNKTVPGSTTASPLSFPWEGLLFAIHTNGTDSFEYNNIVILSGETASRSEAVSQSKDPYELNGGQRAEDFSDD
jgi:hypothetical protein